MKLNQNLYKLTAALIIEFEKVLEDCRSNYFLCIPRYNNNQVTIIAAFYSGAKVCQLKTILMKG